MDKNGLVRHISAVPLFSSLDGNGKKEVAACASFVRAQAKETIFSPGDTADCLYIVIEGEIHLIKRGSHPDERDDREMAHFVSGDYFGEMDMLLDHDRNVFCFAAAPAELVRFPREGLSFRQFLSEHPASGAQILYSFLRITSSRTRVANGLLKENSPRVRELRRQVYEDKLTGLFNKTYLEETLAKELTDKTPPASLLMVKPDNYKQINDTWGHDAGDQVLVYVARKLPEILDENFLLVRFMGNEFGVFARNTGRSAAVLLAEKIRHFYNTLDISAFLKDIPFELSVSIGIAVWPSDAGDWSSFIAAAHELPLKGRAMGGNRILFPQGVCDETENTA